MYKRELIFGAISSCWMLPTDLMDLHGLRMLVNGKPHKKSGQLELPAL
jgi:hypothetical protein